MIHIPTTIILGAGASMPYGFPSGAQLLGRILDALEDRRGSGKQLLDMGFPESTLLDLARELHAAQPPSIDYFLEHRPEFLELGRSAISQQLVACEDEAAFSARTDHWYAYFINLLARDLASFSSNRVRIVTFNYDRSLEMYLYRTLQSRYGQDPASALKSLPIVHVHGKLGDLPWETNATAVRAYSPTTDVASIQLAASGLKIIFEASEASVQFKTARDYIQSSTRIYFLGFGYHPESLLRLGFPYPDGTHKAVRGSHFGLTHPEFQRIFEGRLRMAQKNFGPGMTTLDFLRNCDEQLETD